MNQNDNEANRRVVSGQSWRDFCARLSDAGEVILAADTPDSPLDRAEGFRYLTRLLRLGLEKCLEGADPDFPYFYALSHETAKIGADNPDNAYLNATVRGEFDYRITGRRGTMPYFSINSNAFRFHLDGTCVNTGALMREDITWGPEGEVEIIASATPHPGNWLPLSADSSFIIIRQSCLDRTREKPGSFRIDRIGGPAVPAPLDPAFLDGALRETATFVGGIASTFADWARKFREHPNQMPDLDQQMFQRGGGSPDIYYYHGYFDIGPDEAWVIEVTPPECHYWNFQLDNWWMESMDYRHRRVAVNKHSAKLAADGSLTIVVAARNPGVENWIDTSGHKIGTCLLRWAGSHENPAPRCKIVKLTDWRN